MLAQFALRGHVAVSRSRRANALPLIACAPLQLHDTAVGQRTDNELKVAKFKTYFNLEKAFLVITQ